jgi:UDP-N-acetylmuramoyl-tripeptide--D-alanyl-D-alanine ligase
MKSLQNDVGQMSLTCDQIAKMCDGKLSNNSDLGILVNNVVIDSRIVKQGSLFVAIVGENQDGHNYVTNALNNGAVVAIVNEDSNLQLPNLIRVKDTTLALGKLASNYRKRFEIPVVAITGSNGKTTVKEMLNSICCEFFGADYVLSTTGNLNNHLGVPLTILGLEEKHKVAILEMGMNHAGELDYLSNLAKPTIAVVNNVLWAHAGFFKNLDGIALAKSEIYNGLEDGGIACIDKNLSYATIWAGNLASRKINLSFYGSRDTDCYLDKDSNIEITIINTNIGRIETKLKVLGEHNQKNAVTATNIAIKLGCDIKSISKGLASYLGYKGRLEQKLAFNGATIIDDSYNANPDSVKAAILAIKPFPTPHWFILGDLNELGEFTKAKHMEVGIFAKEHGIEKLLTVGEFGNISGHGYINAVDCKANNHNWHHFDNIEEITEYCRKFLPSKATLLIKGSNSMQLWQIADKLLK